jgi:CHAD domain-containing protein
LETEFTYVRRDLDEIRQDMKGMRETMEAIAAQLGGLKDVPAKMETFSAKLETVSAHLGGLKDVPAKMETLSTRFETVSARLAEKPGKGFVIGTVIAIFGLSAGMVAATVATLQYLQDAM